MCIGANYGNYKKVWVKIPKDLSHQGRAHMALKPIDACIASIVEALQKGGIDMRSSHCGHGKCDGKIELQDGRILKILEG